MNFTSLTTSEPLHVASTFSKDVESMLMMQKDVNTLQDELDEAILIAQKREFHLGYLVEIEKLLSLKQISDVLEPQREKLKEAILTLYNSLMPDDIFISQQYFDTWIKVGTNQVIRFGYDLESIEVEVQEGM